MQSVEMKIRTAGVCLSVTLVCIEVVCDSGSIQ